MRARKSEPWTQENTGWCLQIGCAIWGDVVDLDRLRVTEYGPAFHYETRIIRAETTDNHRIRLEVVAGSGTGLVAEAGDGGIAMAALLRGDVPGEGLYKTTCAHGYWTAQDSCPGCDASGEDFENTYPKLAPVPGGPLPSGQHRLINLTLNAPLVEQEKAFAMLPEHAQAFLGSRPADWAGERLDRYKKMIRGEQHDGQ